MHIVLPCVLAIFIILSPRTLSYPTLLLSTARVLAWRHFQLCHTGKYIYLLSFQHETKQIKHVSHFILSRTTSLDLSYNNISSYYGFDPEKQNYHYISSLILSHNKLTHIDKNLLQLKLDKVFRADDNLITEIPFDFSQLLQKYQNNEVILGQNPWICYCNAEITDLVSKGWAR